MGHVAGSEQQVELSYNLGTDHKLRCKAISSRWTDMFWGYASEIIMIKLFGSFAVYMYFILKKDILTF